MSDKVFVALKTRFCPADRSPVDRWSMWALSIRDRHERTVARQGQLIMTLVQPLQMFTAINQRLEKFALAVFPTIRISIGPILQELSSVSWARDSFVLPRLKDGYAAIVSDRKQPQSRFSLPASMTLATASSHSAESAPGSTEDTSVVSGALADFSQAPLRRLFARIHKQNAGVVVKKTILENESQAIAERVVRDHSRVEQRNRGDMVIRKPSIPGAAAEERRSELESQFARASTRDRSWPEKAPEINVEQLTEQVIRKIDHRITAYRERLGRAF